MSTISTLAWAAFKEKQTDKRADANKAPLAILDNILDLLASEKASPEVIRAGIQGVVLGLVTVSAALSLIPFESNFGSELAGRLMDRLTSPGLEVAINAPIRDYLDDIFPTRELAARQLVQGIETGALTDQDLIETAIDSGLKNREIAKLVKIAKVARFEKETGADYALIDRYQDAVIAAQLAQARVDIDEAIEERKRLINEYKKLAASEAMQAVTE